MVTPAGIYTAANPASASAATLLNGSPTGLLSAGQVRLYPGVPSGTPYPVPYSVSYYTGTAGTAGWITSILETPVWNTFSGPMTGFSSTVDTTYFDSNNGTYGVSNYLYLALRGKLFCLSGLQLDTPLASNIAGYLATGIYTDANANQIPVTVATEDGTPVTLVSNITDNGVHAYTFAGTVNGLYGSAVNPTTGFPTTADGKLPVIPGTSGLNITVLSTSPVSNLRNSQGLVYAAYTAAYSATTQELLVLQNNVVLARYPALAGLPSGPLQFSWDLYRFPTGSSTEILSLVVTGSDATVALPVATWTDLT